MLAVFSMDALLCCAGYHLVFAFEVFLYAEIGTSLLGSSNAPMAMEDPRTLLALLAAIFRPPASSTLGKLPCKFFPFPTLVISTLPYPSTRIILPAQVPHHNASPVLHILTMVSDCKFLDQGEDVEVIWKEIFFFLRVTGRGGVGV